MTAFLLGMLLSTFGYCASRSFRQLGWRTNTALASVLGCLLAYLVPLLPALPLPVAVPTLSPVPETVAELPLAALLVVSAVLILRDLLRSLLLEQKVWRLWSAGVRSRGNAAYVRTDHVSSPCLAGLIRPLILLPLSSNEWSEETLNLVLEHESAHKSRGDHLRLFLGRLNQSLQWWNPLSHLLQRELLLECEIGCDERVCNSREKTRTYVSTLCDLALPATWPAAPAFARQSNLEKRVRFLATTQRRGRTFAAGTAALVIAAALFYALSTKIQTATKAPERLEDARIRLQAQPFGPN